MIESDEVSVMYGNSIRGFFKCVAKESLNDDEAHLQCTWRLCVPFDSTVGQSQLQLGKFKLVQKKQFNV